MATNKQIKFFKGANAPAAPVAGMIWFCTGDRTIRVYTGSEWEKYAGLVDAAWNGTDKKLTITSAAGTTTTLDLSDCASASDLAAKLQTINNTLSAHDGRITAAQNAADAAAQAASVADGKAVQEATDRAAEILRVEGLISAEQARAEGKEAENKAAAAAADKKAADAQTYAEGVNTALGQEVTRATGAEEALGGRIATLEAAVGEGGSVGTQIDAKIADLDADVTSAEGTQVRVQVVEVDGKITEVKVTESATFATAQALADEIADREADELAISNRIGLLDGENGRVKALEDQVSALNAATHFEGVVEFDPAAEGATIEGYESGDIVIYGSKEYIFDGEKWIELGDTTAEQGRISALEGLVGSTSVDSQIDAKINALDATVGTTTIAEGKHVAVEVVEVDGKLTAVNVNENDIASAAKLTEIEGEVDLNTAAVADYKTRIEALEGTANDLGNTYVKVSDYNTDKAALQGEIDAAEGRLDTAEGDIDALQSAIERLDGEQDTQDQAIEAAAALGQQGIDDAADALAEAQAKVASVTSSDSYVAVNNTDAKNPVLSLNVNGAIAEGNTGLVKGGDIFNELCWVEFE